MADGIDIQVRGDLAVMAMLNPAQAIRAVRRGLDKAAVVVYNAASEYPPDANAHRPQPFVSDKQRRYFFWALREGIIEVPYRRGISPGSERHGQSWTMQARNRGLTQVIGSDTTYGPLLQDPDEQTAYHKKTGWKTTRTIADEQADEATDIVNDELYFAMMRG